MFTDKTLTKYEKWHEIISNAECAQCYLNINLLLEDFSLTTIISYNDVIDYYVSMSGIFKTVFADDDKEPDMIYFDYENHLLWVHPTIADISLAEAMDYFS